MPQITQYNAIDITVEKFLNACTDVELLELDLLLSSPRFQNRIKDETIDRPNPVHSITSTDRFVDSKKGLNPIRHGDKNKLSHLDHTDYDIEVIDPELLDGHRGH